MITLFIITSIFWSVFTFILIGCAATSRFSAVMWWLIMFLIASTQIYIGYLGLLT